MISGGYWCLTRILGLLQYKIIKEKLLIDLKVINAMYIG